MLRRIALWAAWLIPAWWLFALHAAFYYDWNASLWMGGYFGAYWRAHGTMPTVLNSSGGIGFPTPMFYGYTLYPLFAPLAAFLGSAVALRCGILAVMALQVHAVQAAVKNIIPHWRVGFAVTLAAVWSVYGLTDLYNRGALPEYFATSLSCAAAGYMVAATAEVRSHRSRFFGWLAAFCAMLAAGMHPPTAVLSGLVFAGAVAGLALASWGRGALRRGYAAWGGALAGLVAGGIILAPWIYLNARLLPRLSNIASPDTLMYIPERCDTWLGRFSLLPYDPAAHLPLDQVSTPYLEATVSGGLLLLGLWFASLWWRLRRAKAYPIVSWWERAAPLLALLALLGFGWFALCSLPAGMNIWPRTLTPYVQFGYRLVAPANLTLLLGALALGSAAARRGAFQLRRRETAVAATAILLFVALGTAIKLRHGGAIRTEDRSAQNYGRGDGAALMARGWANWDYATLGAWPELPAPALAGASHLDLPIVATNDHFGRVGVGQLDRNRPGWCVTNVMPFVWNELKVNGHMAAPDEISRVQNQLAVKVPAGHSTIEWAWRPDPRWVVLHRIGRWTLLAALLFTALWAVAIKKRLPSLGA